MKFKVGDVVRMRKGLIDGKTYGGVLYLSKMKTSRPMTITWTESQQRSSGYCQVEENDYFWTDEMLEPVEEPAKRSIMIEVEGNKVTAMEGKKKGIARCSPEDEFNLPEGVRLAVERMESSWPNKGDLFYAVEGSISHLSVKKESYYENLEYDQVRKKKNMLFRTEKEAVAFMNRLNEFIRKDRKLE